MQVHDFTKVHSVMQRYVLELRSIEHHKDKEGFRHNLKRVARCLAYELSHYLGYSQKTIQTPLAPCDQFDLDVDIVAISILRAGLAMHDGILDVFPDAQSGFLGAYRKHENGNFDIHIGYVTCPNLDKCTLILTDPMLATGRSIEAAMRALEAFGPPHEVHIVAAIASRAGLDAISKLSISNGHLWVAAVDDDLTPEQYITPGLGDAGDLSYGTKQQK